jgi:alkylation response protein AidB-like acyl-CoA dehydrogenase
MAGLDTLLRSARANDRAERMPRRRVAWAMEQSQPALHIDARSRDLCQALRESVPDMQSRATALDLAGTFPEADIALLRDLGALAAPLPIGLGGLGLGTDPAGARDLMQAHVNAIRLVTRYGTDTQLRTVAASALEGKLFGLWVTDAPRAPLHCQEDGILAGSKAPCSGAGHLARAVATATMANGETRMLLLELDTADRADFSGWDTHGMRAATNGSMDLTGLRIEPNNVLGEANDYLREPDFSAGAWRTSAVTLGGIEALVSEMRRSLVARGRAEDPNQNARAGQALIAQHTARLWMQQAAIAGETMQGDAADRINLVNLARIAVEAAALAIIPLVQRSLGMAAFRRGTLTELLFRDLAMYLRQPAPDETLAAAAANFMQRDLPDLA